MAIDRTEPTTVGQYDVVANSTTTALSLYIDKPGTLTIVWASTNEGSSHTPVAMSLRPMSLAALLAEMTNISFAGIVALAFLLRLTLMSVLWSAAVSVLYFFSDRCLMTLPRRIRAEAQREVHAILGVARWGGYASFLVWTVKDVIEFALH